MCTQSMFYDGYCYIWNETEGGPNGEEFASVCCQLIEKKVMSQVDKKENNARRKVILYSDGNRNCIISNALMNDTQNCY